MINLKQSLNYGLVLKKVDRVITYHQSAWLKSYIAKKWQKIDLKNIFLS